MTSFNNNSLVLLFLSLLLFRSLNFLVVSFGHLPQFCSLNFLELGYFESCLLKDVNLFLSNLSNLAALDVIFLNFLLDLLFTLI